MAKPVLGIALMFLLGCVAWWQPVALYVCAMGVFGLPHVIWEMVWIRQVWGNALSRATWLGMLITLSIQAASRFALWKGWIEPQTAAVMDAWTLGAALLAVAGFYRQRPSEGRVKQGIFFVALLLLTVSLWAISATPAVVGLLAILAMGHNFTPVLLMPRTARIGPWPARAFAAIVFAGPVVLCVGLLLAPEVTMSRHDLVPAELGWAQGYSARVAGALLPALIWAQCLHYMMVLYWMPKAIGQQWKGMRGVQRAAMLPCVVLVCTMLSVFFYTDFYAARGLYAVASGVHAWLEWPLILVLAGRCLGSIDQPAQGVRREVS